MKLSSMLWRLKIGWVRVANHTKSCSGVVVYEKIIFRHIISAEYREEIVET